MNKLTENVIKRFLTDHPELDQVKLVEAFEIINKSYKMGGKLLVCGNGGSASDALHIVGELMKGFLLPRKLENELREKITTSFPDSADYFLSNLQQSIPAISLVNEVSLMSAYSNDKAPDLVFAQQILGHGKANDVFIGISTSGNSKNVLYAAQIAKVLGLKIITLTGESGGQLKNLSDVLLNMPTNETYVVQEQHIIVYHALCAALEAEFFSENTD